MNEYFWDSCALIEYLRDGGDQEKVKNLQYFLDDAKRGKCRIHISSLSIAELLPSQIRHSKYGKFDDFLRDFNGHLIPILPNTNIMNFAARLRDNVYEKFASKHTGYHPRYLGTPDAIILSSAVYLKIASGIEITAFHTYDKGKRRDNETGKKSVPILGFQDWCCTTKNKYDPIVQDVISIPRMMPVYDEPRLDV